MDKVRETPFEELPTIKKVLGRIQRKDGTLSYQTAELKFYEDGLEYIKSHHVEWVEAIEVCLLQRLRPQTHELELLTHAITILATHGWQQSVCQRFCVPFEKANIDLSLGQEEWDNMLEYSKRYLNLVQEDYKVIWWKLFNSIDANKWTNILAIVKLLFCLPIANG